MLKFCLSLIFFSNCLLISVRCDRTFDFQWNPQCNDDICLKPNEKNSFNNLVYLKAVGPNDTLHFLYSNIQTFTIMAFKTSSNAKISINYTDLLSGNYQDSINFNEEPIESAGYAFPIIYDFNDENGDADMNTKIPQNSSYWKTYLTSDLIWSNFTAKTGNVIGVFEGKTDPKVNGSFKFVVKYLGSEKRDEDLPHLLLTQDAFAVDFIIDSVECKFKDSKFGLGVYFLSKKNQISMTSERNLDDEYTPGTFKLFNVKVADKATNATTNFFQWKPIFYLEDPRTLEKSTITFQYKVVDNLEVPVGIASAFFDNSTKAHAMNISFGIEGNEKDGYYYIQSNYSVWTFSAGFGAAPSEKMSPVVTLVIFIGFGVPALVIFVGLIVMVVRKIRGSPAANLSYEPVQ